MSATTTVSTENWSEEVLNSSTPVLVDFWAEWCEPCKAIAPMLEQIAAEKQGAVKIAKVNSDENPQLARDLNVMGIPTLVMFKDGEPVDTIVGLQPKTTIEKMIAKTL